MSITLYGIGNALVDQEYPIDDDFLTKTGLTKGTMQLTDADTQRAMIASLGEHTQSAGQVSGGSGANTIYAFSALGGKAFYACHVGNDDLGQFYLDDLSAGGVHVSAQSAGLGQTGTCLVMITPDGERTMMTHLGITTDLSVDHIDLSPLANAQFLYIEGYLATSQTARDAVRHARAQINADTQNTTKTAISLSDPAMVQYAKDGLLDLIGEGVDILFCNEQEALMFTAAPDVKAAVRALQEFSPLVIVTRGSEGALVAYQEEVHIAIKAHPVAQVIDTNGAGDAFSGAFLYGLSQGFTLGKSGDLAAAVSATLVGQFGARLRREQYGEILTTIQSAEQ